MSNSVFTLKKLFFIPKFCKINIKISDEISTGKVWIALDFEKYQAVSELELQPVLLLQLDNSISDGLIREMERQDLGASKNMSYAFQWFFLAITVFILFLALNVKRSSA